MVGLDPPKPQENDLGREGRDGEGGQLARCPPCASPMRAAPPAVPIPVPTPSSISPECDEQLGGEEDAREPRRCFLPCFWIPLAFATLSSSCAPLLLSRENLCLPGEEQIEFPNPRARAGCSLLPCLLSARFPLPPRTPAWGKPWWLCTAGAPLGATARRTGSQRCPRGRLHYLLAPS